MPAVKAVVTREKDVPQGYREKGYYPGAFINMLALLGWNPGTDQEIMSLEELTRLFDLSRVHKEGAKFDPDKTKWFNQQYLRERPDAELGAQLQVRLGAKGIETTLERATFVDHMLEGTYLFTSGLPLEAGSAAEEELRKRWKPELAPALEAYIKAMEGLNTFGPADLEPTFNTVLQENGLKSRPIDADLPAIRGGSHAGPWHVR